MAFNCYICSQMLTSANRSVEHILLNALGGKLKSSNLLCKTCNSQFGNSIDAMIIKQLASFAALFNVKRDHGKTPVVYAHMQETNESVIIKPGGKPETRTKAPHIEKIDDHTVFVKISAPNMKIARQQAKEIQKKYPKLNPDALLSQAKEIQTDPFPVITFKQDIGGLETRQSACKSLINYYVHTGGDITDIQHLIPYICGQTIPNPEPVGFFYPHNPLSESHEGLISHGISIVGRPDESILFGHIEYFNILSYLVILNAHYTGPAIENSYFYDLVHHHCLNMKPDWSQYKRDEIVQICSRKSLEQLDINNILNSVQNFLNKLGEIQRANQIETLLHEACSGLKEGDAITREHIERFLELLEEKMLGPLMTNKYKEAYQNG